MDKDVYVLGAFISGILGGIAIWIYAIAEWGLLFGLIFGWFPAIIGGFIVGFTWPLIVAGAFVLFLMITYNS